MASATNNELTEGILLGMGNPLLDIQVNVEKDLLDKYEMKENCAILAEDKHLALFEEIVKREGIEYIPGGATQNALRVFQWIICKPNASTFFGAVGKDKYSEILYNQSKNAGVNVCYQVNKSVKTGTCAALIYKHHRSLCADLAAANTFTLDHLQSEANDALVKRQNSITYLVSS
uniref:Adenosine kinase n=1 Tax=Ditylenchus dipsaci TaxID=166011 RepID=A0A915D1F4_9BILA